MNRIVQGRVSHMCINLYVQRERNVTPQDNLNVLLELEQFASQGKRERGKERERASASTSVCVCERENTNLLRG